MTKVAVIGAGVAGITTAFLAANEGYEVTIYDRGEIASECSHANGGQLSVSNAKTWNSMSNVMHGIQWMFDKKAPLAMRFDHWSKDKVMWLARFLSAIPNQEANTRETIATALRSRELMHMINKYTGINYDVRRTGILHVYCSDMALDLAAEDCRKYKETGWDRDIVELDVMRHIEPNLRYDNIVGGTFTPGDFTGDIYLFCTELAKFMQENMGVKIYENLSVDRVFFDKLTRRNDYVFLCTGAYTKDFDFAKTKIYPIKGYSVTYKTDVMPKVSILDDEAKIVTSAFDGRFRVAGTAELAGWDHSVREDRLVPLKEWVKKKTYVSGEPDSSWACLRPMNPDMMPTVEKYGNVIVNSGAGHLGWTMGMALAERAVGYAK